MAAVTRKIAGRELTLEQDRRYVAEQLLEDEGLVTVTIHRWDQWALTADPEPVARLHGLSLDEADDFVSEFNGPGRSRTRVW